MPSHFLIKQTAILVAAYVTRNQLTSANLPAVIEGIHTALRALRTSQDREDKRVITLTGAEIAASVRHDCIISFVDGRQYKSLKHHLTAHGLTPERYSAQYGLPTDYSMVAPSYAAQRSQIARAIGLGLEAA